MRGPLHRQEGRPNEDAWLRTGGAFGALTVVCDGMGSKPNARTGSRAACCAVKEAVLRWAKVDNAPLSYLPHLIEIFWRLRIHPTEPGSAATTCLFAFASKNGRWVLGGVGDGLALARTGSELRIVVGNRREGFSNETTGLGVSPGIRAWQLMELPPTKQDRMAVLATDGISDDLIPEKLNEFCEWLVEASHGLSQAERSRALASELRAWPTPGHLDDKTLAILHAPVAALETLK